MNVNVTHVEIKANSEFVEFAIQMQVPTNEPLTKYRFHWETSEKVEDAELRARQQREYRRQFTLHKSEVEYILTILDNTAKFLPYFDDGIHFVKFYSNCVREVYTGNGHEEFWMTFPVWEIKAGLLAALDCQEDERTTVAEYTKVICDRWSEQYGPRFRWEMHNWYGDDVPAIEEKVKADTTNPLAPGLTDALELLERIACNHSDGQENVIQLSYDSRPRVDEPASYYFCVVDHEGRRIMNGGIIAHPEYEGEYGKGKIVGWKYSTHT